MFDSSTLVYIESISGDVHTCHTIGWLLNFGALNQYLFVAHSVANSEVDDDSANSTAPFPHK